MKSLILSLGRIDNWLGPPIFVLGLYLIGASITAIWFIKYRQENLEIGINTTKILSAIYMLFGIVFIISGLFIVDPNNDIAILGSTFIMILIPGFVFSMSMAEIKEVILKKNEYSEYNATLNNMCTMLFCILAVAAIVVTPIVLVFCL